MENLLEHYFEMKKKYDLVTLIYTLEHILDPEKIIKNARKIQRKGKR